jgi:hypothetical protein
MDIHDKIKEMTPFEVRSELEKAVVNAETFKIAEGVCYDRTLCERLGIDYNRLPNDHYLKAVLYAVHTSHTK